jgi:hypothetical protein
MRGIFVMGNKGEGTLPLASPLPPELGCVMTVSKPKSFATDFTVANSWQILSANPAQILAAGEIKSTPSIIFLKFMPDFHLRITSFCA